MNPWMQFVVGMAEALGWPLAVSFIVWLLRSSIKRVIGRVSVISHKDTRIEIASQARELVDETAPAAIEATKREQPAALNHSFPGPSEPARAAMDYIAAWRPRALRTALVSPTEAVLDSWSLVVDAMKYLGARFELPLDTTPDHALLHSLLQAPNDPPLVDPVTAENIDQLRVLRNRVAHASDGAPELQRVVADYVDSAANIAVTLVGRSSQRDCRS